MAATSPYHLQHQKELFQRTPFEPQGRHWHQQEEWIQYVPNVSHRRRLSERHMLLGSDADWRISHGHRSLTRLQPSASQRPPTPSASSHGLAAALPLWRRLLPLLGGFVVNMLLGCSYSLGSIAPYASSFMRYKGQVDIRHSDLGWVFTAGLASVCLAMAYGNKLHSSIGLGPCAFFGCMLMSCSFLLSASTCHSLFLFTITCGAGTGLALGVASVCPLTAAYLTWSEHRGLAAAVVLSGLSASPILFSALEVSLVNPKRVPFSTVPYADHPYERYLENPEVLSRVPRFFWGLGCCCLLLAPAALLLDVPHAMGRGRKRADSTSSSCFASPSAIPATAPAHSVDEDQQQHLSLPASPAQHQWGSHALWDTDSRVESEMAHPSGKPSGVVSIWMVYVLLGLAVHFIGIFWEAVAFALHAPELSTDPEAAALAEARQQQQRLSHQISLQQKDPGAISEAGFAGLGSGVMAVASLLGRVGWGILTDVYGGATAVRALCFCLTVLLGCCAAALHGSLHFFLGWLFLLYVCIGGISVTLPLVVAEVASPADFSWLYTLAYTSKPASAALSSLLLTLFYPSVGLSGCSAFAATAASLAFLICSYIPRRKVEKCGGACLWEINEGAGLSFS